jgi:TonB family protein
MNPIIIYFIKSTLGTGIFFLAYVLIIKKQRDFRFNRYYLVFSTVLAAIIPLINTEMATTHFQNPINQITGIPLQEVIIGQVSGPALSLDVTWETLLYVIYWIGLIFMTGRFMISLFQLYNLITKSETKNNDKLKIIFPKEKLPVFSFFHWVFINRDFYENQEAQSILQHEKVHVDQKHSIDLIALQLLCIFQWFNPFLYLIKKSVKENHEFIADGDICLSTNPLSAYQMLLFSQASGIEFSPLTNNFNYSLLIKRMIMMKNEKSPKNSTLKIFGALIALSLTLFACNNAKQTSPESPNKAAIVTNDGKSIIRDQTPGEQAAVAAQVDTGQIFMVVEKMPKFPGGLNALMHYLASNIHYPEQAKKDTIQGRVFVNFIIEKDGSVTHAKVLRGIGHGCDQEALRVVKQLPRWEPGYQRGKPVRVSFNLPIKFTLE